MQSSIKTKLIGMGVAFAIVVAISSTFAYFFA